MVELQATNGKPGLAPEASPDARRNRAIEKPPYYSQIFQAPTVRAYHLYTRVPAMPIFYETKRPATGTRDP